MFTSIEVVGYTTDSPPRCWRRCALCWTLLSHHRLDFLRHEPGLHQYEFGVLAPREARALHAEAMLTIEKAGNKLPPREPDEARELQALLADPALDLVVVRRTTDESGM